MSDEQQSPPDLASIDLARSFMPSWAQDTAPSKQLERLAAKHDREERPERFDRSRDQRGPRSDRRPPRGGDDKRGARRPGKREDRPPERGPRQPDPITGWDVQFLPDKHGVDGLAKQIKSTAKAYPLFDLAQLVLEKSERYLVEFKKASEDAPAIFQLKADGSLWLSEREALSHALATQLDKFYRRERVAVDPPKGVYQAVAVCGMSGVVIGPSNYHDYQTKLIKLHAERFANMPFEAFKSRIRMERDEEAIAKWKDEQSAKDVFYPIDLSKPAAEVTPEAIVETPAPVEAEIAGEAAQPAEEIAAEPVEISETPEEIAPEAIERAESAVEDAAPADPVETPEAPVEISEPQAEAAPEERLESLADVEKHFREHHAAKAIVQIRQRVAAPGPPAMNSSSPAIHTLARQKWEQLRRFPLPLLHTLGQLLASRGVHIFKAHENITYASVARPKYLDRTEAPIAAGPAAILDYLEASTRVPRHEQWKALLALRPVPAEGAEDQREISLAADLLWLLHQGHVIDFAKRNLEAARKPKPPAPKPTKKQTAPVAPKTSAAVAEPDAPVEKAAEVPALPPEVVEPAVAASEPPVAAEGESIPATE
jgi:hypothetical protein